MIIENKLDNKSFGPFASSAGLGFLVIGLIFSFFNLFGLILAISGAFIAFTCTGTIIDTENKRIRHADYLFGLIPVGKWILLRSDMKLGLKEVRRGYRAYSRGAQPADIHYRDIRIFLYDPNNKKLIIPVKKFRTPEEAKAGIADYEKLLSL